MSTSARNYAVTNEGSSTTLSRKVESRVPLRDPFWAHSTDLSDRRWEAVIVPKIMELAALEAGWDGYSAPAISFEAIGFSIMLLNNLMRPSTPCPQVVPTASGAIQFEWHEKGIDLEVRVSGAYECEVYYEDQQAPQQITELSLGADLAPLIRLADELRSR